MLAIILSIFAWNGGYHFGRVKARADWQAKDAWWLKNYQAMEAGYNADQAWIAQDKINRANELNQIKNIYLDGLVKLAAADKDVERAVFNDGVTTAILIERKNPNHWDLSGLQIVAWNNSESKKLLDEKP